MTRPLHHTLLLTTLCLAISCSQNKPQDTLEAPRQALNNALNALNSSDIQTYLHYVDTDHMNQASTDAMRQVLALHLMRQQAEGTTPTSYKIIDGTIENDTICTIYYQYTYPNGNTETFSQKMIRHNDDWKLKLRE